MLEKVNIHSSVAVYVQIANHVQFAIASGKLKAGDKLTPILELAKRIGVNMNTVAKAYRDLDVMGYVYSRRGMGVFISKGVEARCRDACRKRIIARLHEVVTEAKAAGMNAAEVKKIVVNSFGANVGPYGETPSGLLALAKKK